ncbi:MAG: FAD-binding protein [Litorilinea sp.]|nr:MAG: FAD-binding protein [Litorilinea sp.]
MADVIIIGGGPAGAALGCYLSRAGIDNIIFEGANFPRAHVGESLVTSTVAIFKELGFLQTMEEAGFVRKFGAAWHAPGGRSLSLRFNAVPEEGIDQDYTYHVDRAQFDLLLLKHAEKLGSRVYQGTHVRRVLLDEAGQARGVCVQVGSSEVEVPARVVVDASGRNTLLGRQLRLKQKDPIFNQYAVHAWFKNLDRGEGEEADYIHIYFLPVERGWVWQIPINDEITSIGVVAEKDIFKGSREDIEGYFLRHAHMNPDLAHAMRHAVRVTEFNAEGDYSYSMRRFVGDGYLLVGDAARFVDPIFSSGVSVALFSAKFAAERIAHAFALGDFGEHVFLPYEEKLRAGVEIWYEFIRLYYKLLPLFTHFVQSPQYRREIERLLQGLVFDRKEARVLQAMREYIAKVEASENHLLRGQLSPIPID